MMAPCRLLALPRELRDQVYRYLFDSTRLKFGERHDYFSVLQYLVPQPNSLAILRTCHQIHAEARDIWIKRVLFDFEHGVAMMDKLSSLPPDTLSKIRHVRVTGDVVLLNITDTWRMAQNAGDVVFRRNWLYGFRLVAFLRLLPTLQLDTLTVLLESCDNGRSYTINSMIHGSNGWKTLHVISGGSLPLGNWSKNDNWMDRKGNGKLTWGGEWRRQLAKRDGSEANGTVSLYRSTVEDVPGSSCNPDTRDEIKEEADVFTHRTWTFKESLVTVTRGRKVDITQQGPLTPLIDRYWSTIPDWDFSGTTWAKIRNDHAICVDNWRCSGPKPDEPVPVVYDQYNDPFEFKW
ncbi:hypothetical protein CC80DRAFT_589880 [Byssothecium circinans]|uniref:F-box domain-containing protein n=1 Tax=Byssothecium circinans TaxID=147558 RepID=A0A6A5U9D6_9PLEO|nr:hypothetical protein CC80DRAFT_589880 [Byssothecium circinans]